MADQSDLAGDLLRGGKKLALEIYGRDDKKTVRRLYHEQARWPVFQLDATGVLYGLRSRIRAHIEAKSAEKEARIAAAAAKTVAPRLRRRRARSSR